MSGDLFPEYTWTRGLAVQRQSEGRGSGCDQYVHRRRGNLHQHQRDFDPDQPHRCAFRHATATGPLPGLGQNWNPTAGGKEHDSSLPRVLKARENERRPSMISRGPSTHAGRLEGQDQK